MKKALISLVFVLAAGSASQAYQSEDFYDSNPLLCKEYRSMASRECRGDNDCYTSEVSRLVDMYNSNLQYDENAQELFCNY
ncbi:MAG: hypothetical protein A2622_00145 [Bdellovibrionales bacterium RIFCSPHIGHO2_01_FULL_40_29]|nr:MAG: hypothetical protein A2622_00145 [Bdellovibrionales bacterium RIFCSPHIGHO2_01_FULL_40_29]OFZ32537.1 MAG: hypothetical protein A3D17_04745 [Bdellovibrionales bacterium RIFCSPHIGHO2_02_FULL_40_15]